MKNSIYILSMVSIMLFFASCTTGDLEHAKKLASKKSPVPVERTYDVQMIYSDSAKVKAVGFAPVLEKYTPKNGKNYEIMPKGLKVDFYDEHTKIKTTVTADSAIRKDFEKITILKRHVVAKNPQGSTFNSEELIWDENTQKFYSNLTVKVTNPQGDVLYGTGFNAKQDFSTYTFTGTKGEANVKGNSLFENP